MTETKGSAEQVELVNQIWDLSVLLDPDFGAESLKQLVRDDSGSLKSPYDLRKVVHQLRKKHRSPVPSLPE